MDAWPNKKHVPVYFLGGSNMTISLFSFLRIGFLELQHRVVMALLTRMRASRPGAASTALNAEHYGQRASQGGLIVTEATQISMQGKGLPRTAGIHTDERTAGWKLVTDAGHARDGLNFLQDGSNHRTDEYGGNIANRCRLLLEVTDAVSSVPSATRVGIRFSPFGTLGDMSDSNPIALFSHAIQAASSRKIAYVPLVEPRANAGQTDEPDCDRPAPAAALFRGLFDGPLIASGGVPDKQPKPLFQEATQMRWLLADASFPIPTYRALSNYMFLLIRTIVPYSMAAQRRVALAIRRLGMPGIL
jgi:2,4-dienoyl-CoA reductase-like NADH-dependent reductase (Old Yellow Enzyme family)